MQEMGQSVSRVEGSMGELLLYNVSSRMVSARICAAHVPRTGPGTP